MTRNLTIGWEILFIVLTSLVPVWVYFMRTDPVKASLGQKVVYHSFAFPFYNVQYFLLYCFTADFVLSAICHNETTPFCVSNYDDVRYLSLYIAIILLVIVTAAQVIDALSFSDKIVQTARRKRKEARNSIESAYYGMMGKKPDIKRTVKKKVKRRQKKKQEIRKSVENTYYSMFGKRPSVKEKVDKEVNRRMQKFKQGRRSSSAQLTLVESARAQIDRIVNTGDYVPLKPIYDLIDEISKENIIDAIKEETDLHLAIEGRINKLKMSGSSKLMALLVPLRQMIAEVKNEMIRNSMNDLLMAYLSRREMV